MLEREVKPLRREKLLRVPLSGNDYESFLPQRVLPADRDRSARVAREPDADPEEAITARPAPTRSFAGLIISNPRSFGQVFRPEQRVDHGHEDGREEDEDHRPLPE